MLLFNCKEIQKSFSAQLSLKLLCFCKLILSRKLIPSENYSPGEFNKASSYIN